MPIEKAEQINNTEHQDEILSGRDSTLPQHESIVIDPKLDEKTPISSLTNYSLSEKMEKYGRFFIFLICAGVIVIGRYSVPDNRVQCVQDKIMDSLQAANQFINQAGNEFYRDLFQVLCSFFVDLTFLTTFAYWIARGKSVRLPVALGVFYIVRALVQKVWYSPYPEGFYWKHPGIPSLAVHYGGGSDFFFSGHSGFMVICASEWHKIGMKKIRNTVMGMGLYTFLILLVYRIHYSIDIFTGAIFAEWCYIKADLYKDQLDGLWRYLVSRFMRLFGKKYISLSFSENQECLPC